MSVFSFFTSAPLESEMIPRKYMETIRFLLRAPRHLSWQQRSSGIGRKLRHSGQVVALRCSRINQPSSALFCPGSSGVQYERPLLLMVVVAMMFGKLKLSSGKWKEKVGGIYPA